MSVMAMQIQDFNNRIQTNTNTITTNPSLLETLKQQNRIIDEMERNNLTNPSSTTTTYFQSSFTQPSQNFQNLGHENGIDLQNSRSNLALNLINTNTSQPQQPSLANSVVAALNERNVLRLQQARAAQTLKIQQQCAAIQNLKRQQAQAAVEAVVAAQAQQQAQAQAQARFFTTATSSTQPTTTTTAYLRQSIINPSSQPRRLSLQLSDAMQIETLASLQSSNSKNTTINATNSNPTSPTTYLTSFQKLNNPSTNSLHPFQKLNPQTTQQQLNTTTFQKLNAPATNPHQQQQQQQLNVFQKLNSQSNQQPQQQQIHTTIYVIPGAPALPINKVVPETMSPMQPLKTFPALPLSNFVVYLVNRIWYRGQVECRNEAKPNYSELTKFVEDTLKITDLSLNTVLLSLRYIYKLRQTYLQPKAILEWNIHDLIAVNFMLANKFLSDDRYSNSVWASVTNIDLDTMNAMEMKALDSLGFDLNVPEADFKLWEKNIAQLGKELRQRMSQHLAQQALNRNNLKKQQAELCSLLNESMVNMSSTTDMNTGNNSGHSSPMKITVQMNHPTHTTNTPTKITLQMNSLNHPNTNLANNSICTSTHPNTSNPLNTLVQIGRTATSNPNPNQTLVQINRSTTPNPNPTLVQINRSTTPNPTQTFVHQNTMVSNSTTNPNLTNVNIISLPPPPSGTTTNTIYKVCHDRVSNPATVFTTISPSYSVTQQHATSNPSPAYSIVAMDQNGNTSNTTTTTTTALVRPIAQTQQDTPMEIYIADANRKTKLDMANLQNSITLQQQQQQQQQSLLLSTTSYPSSSTVTTPNDLLFNLNLTTNAMIMAAAASTNRKTTDLTTNRMIVHQPSTSSLSLSQKQTLTEATTTVTGLSNPVLNTLSTPDGIYPSPPPYCLPSSSNPNTTSSSTLNPTTSTLPLSNFVTANLQEINLMDHEANHLQQQRNLSNTTTITTTNLGMTNNSLNSSPLSNTNLGVNSFGNNIRKSMVNTTLHNKINANKTKNTLSQINGMNMSRISPLAQQHVLNNKTYFLKRSSSNGNLSDFNSMNTSLKRVTSNTSLESAVRLGLILSSTTTSSTSPSFSSSPNTTFTSTASDNFSSPKKMRYTMIPTNLQNSSAPGIVLQNCNFLQRPNSTDISSLMTTSPLPTINVIQQPQPSQIINNNGNLQIFNPMPNNNNNNNTNTTTTTTLNRTTNHSIQGQPQQIHTIFY